MWNVTMVLTIVNHYSTARTFIYLFFFWLVLNMYWKYIKKQCKHFSAPIKWWRKLTDKNKRVSEKQPITMGLFYGSSFLFFFFGSCCCWCCWIKLEWRCNWRFNLLQANRKITEHEIDEKSLQFSRFRIRY